MILIRRKKKHRHFNAEFQSSFWIHQPANKEIPSLITNRIRINKISQQNALKKRRTKGDIQFNVHRYRQTPNWGSLQLINRMHSQRTLCHCLRLFGEKMFASQRCWMMFVQNRAHSSPQCVHRRTHAWAYVYSWNEAKNHNENINENLSTSWRVLFSVHSLSAFINMLSFVRVVVGQIKTGTNAIYRRVDHRMQYVYIVNMCVAVCVRILVFNAPENRSNSKVLVCRSYVYSCSFCFPSLALNSQSRPHFAAMYTR